MSELPDDWRDQLKAVYPHRKGQGWIRAKQQIENHLANGEDFEAMLRGADNYRRHVAATNEFVRMAQTFFGPNMWWLEFQDDVEVSNEITLDDTARECGLERGPDESDESLKQRIGVAQTKAIYGY